MPKYRFRILKRGDGRYQPQWKSVDPYDDWANVLPEGRTTLTLWGAERRCAKFQRLLAKYEKKNRTEVVEEWTV